MSLILSKLLFLHWSLSWVCQQATLCPGSIRGCLGLLPFTVSPGLNPHWFSQPYVVVTPLPGSGAPGWRALSHLYWKLFVVTLLSLEDLFSYMVFNLLVMSSSSVGLLFMGVLFLQINFEFFWDIEFYYFYTNFYVNFCAWNSVFLSCTSDFSWVILFPPVNLDSLHWTGRQNFSGPHFTDGTKLRDFV